MVVDPSGRATRTVYNAAGQPVEVERWFTASVDDAAAELDARGNRTQLTYDGLGRVIITTYADGRETHHLTNERGEVAYFKTRGDTRRDHLYDQLGRIQLTREFDMAGSHDWPIGRITQAAYDLAGRTTARNVATQASTTWDDSLVRDVHIYGYDGAGRPTTDQWTPQWGGASHTLTYGYDASGNRTSIQWADGFIAAYAFDAANRPSGVSFGGHTATLAHDSLSRRTGVGRSNGANTSYSYSANSELMGIGTTWNPATGAGTANFSYGRDLAGRITSIATNRPTRLEWQPSEAYAKDYGPANAMNQLASAGGQALTFNAEGALTHYNGWTYGWTVGNRLVSATRPGRTVTYAYDGEDRRTVVIEDGVMTRTQWSGADEVAEYDGAGNLLRRYIPDGSGQMDARLATVAADGTIHWHHTDHQGSVIATSTAAGSPTKYINYSPHGELGVSAGEQITGLPAGSRFGYTGRAYDASTGLYYYRARYYHPGLGLFLSQDPIGSKDDPNLYLYVGIDPVNATDPTGEHRLIRLGVNLARRTIQNRGNVVRAVREEGASIAGDVATLVAPGSSTTDRVVAGIDLISPITVSEARSAVRAVSRTSDQIRRNAAQGRRGEAVTRERLGDSVAGEQVTFVTSDGRRARPDFVTNDRDIVEAKTGNADLTSNQRQLFDDVEAGRPVTPVGENARSAGLEPGVQVRMQSCRVDRSC